MNDSNLRFEIVQRLVLAKNLYRSGCLACSSERDSIKFAQGVVCFHDAVELSLGAIADHLNVYIKDKTYLLDYFRLIRDTDKEKRVVPYYTQIKVLNTLRNDIKHKGILPDPVSNRHFPTTIDAYFKEICPLFFNIDFDGINLKILITNDKVQKLISEAEELLEEGKYEECLIKQAFAMYWIIDRDFLPFRWPGDKNVSPVDFPEHYKVESRVKLLEHGVDPQLYRQFQLLTPSVGRVYESKELIYWWNKRYGHAGNWTENNARLCLNILVDTALKFEEEDNLGLVNYIEMFADIIEPINEEVTIWNISLNPPKYLFKIPERKPNRILKKGERIIGVAYDSKDNMEELLVMDFAKNLANVDSIGYVHRSEVKVTSVPIEEVINDIKVGED